MSEKVISAAVSELTRLNTFIRSLESPGSTLCDTIREEALADDVPIIRPETASLLLFMIDLIRPKRILEVGTATGYSALRMWERMPQDCVIDTIEKYPPRIEKAKENFAKAKSGERIRLYEGDAAEVLERLEGPYDLVFMDAAKGQYISFLPRVLTLLAEGGVLFSDNVLQEGEVLESRFAVTRRNRTIHSRMREYLYVLTHTEGITSSVVPVGDGAALTVKRGE